MLFAILWSNLRHVIANSSTYLKKVNDGQNIRLGLFASLVSRLTTTAHHPTGRKFDHQNIDVARAFSHNPTLVSQPGHSEMKHNGEIPGYLYVVSEEVNPADVYPHPHPINDTYWEWLIVRELRVTLLKRTQVRDEERLTAKEIEELRRRQAEAGTESSVVQ